MAQKTKARPVVLTIAGSDSGGGAGIQADLRVISSLGGYGVTAITALTAQNLSGVRSIMPASKASLQDQIRMVFRGFRVLAVKTGMLFSAELVSVVAKAMKEFDVHNLVVDPVMVSTSGAALLEENAIEAYRKELMPLARVVTPNLDEANILFGREMHTTEEMKEFIEKYASENKKAIFLKGGHAEDKIVDYLWDGDRIFTWSRERVKSINSHGTGCILSAAIATNLAKGLRLSEACDKAFQWMSEALENPIHLEGDLSLIGIENVNSVQTS